MNDNERYSRQSSLIPAKIKETPVTIIGCGAIGRNVALQLASMGAEHLRLYDFDTVEESNVASQGFLESQIGMSKVKAVAKSCKAINKNMTITAINDRFVKSNDTDDIVFMCVDTMEGRKIIAGALGRRQNTHLAIDGRMAGETARVLCFSPTDETEMTEYMETIIPEKIAYQGSCTAKSTIYCSNIISGFMTNIFAKWLRDVDRDRDFMIDIMSNEIFMS